MTTVPHQQEQEVLNWYREQFQNFVEGFDSEEQKHQLDHRKKALELFLSTGFPHRKDESWRFTNIQPITQQRFSVPGNCGEVSSEVLERSTFDDVYRVTIIDGFFSKNNSHDIPSIILKSFREYLSKTNNSQLGSTDLNVQRTSSAFALLNTVFFHDGLFLSVPDDVEVDKPIFILFITTERNVPTLFSPRIIYTIGNKSRVTIIEKHITMSGNSYFVNSVTTLHLHERAHLNYTRVYEEGACGYHISTTTIEQQRESSLTSNVVVLGGAIHRSDFKVVLNGEHSEAYLNGLSFGNGTQLIDHHTFVEHSSPHCKSTQLYKAVLSEKSRGVFNGRIYVHSSAQKTDAQQSNKTLLLSDDAMMHTKPQLEIFADDVRCTHGAAIGQLDETQVFYLRSRGIDEKAARTLLTFGFANETLDIIPHPLLREQIEGTVAKKLQNHL